MNYESFKLTRKQNNKLIPNRKLNMFSTVKAYYNSHGVTLQYYTNWLGKLVAILTLPLVIIIEGVANTKSICEELYGVLFQEKTKSYMIDYIPSSSKLYYKLETIYESKK